MLSNVTSEPALVQNASAFNDAMASNDFQNYCGYKVKKTLFSKTKKEGFFMVVFVLLCSSFFLFAKSSLPSRVFCRTPTSLPTTETKIKCVDIREWNLTGVIPAPKGVSLATLSEGHDPITKHTSLLLLLLTLELLPKSLILHQRK